MAATGRLQQANLLVAGAVIIRLAAIARTPTALGAGVLIRLTQNVLRSWNEGRGKRQPL